MAAIAETMATEAESSGSRRTKERSTLTQRIGSVRR